MLQKSNWNTGISPKRDSKRNMGSCQQARCRVDSWRRSFTWSVTVTEKILKRHSISGRAFHGLSWAGCPGVFFLWGGATRWDLSHLQPRSSGQWGAACPQRLPGPGGSGRVGRDKWLNSARGAAQSHLRGSGYVVLLLLTGLPPFMMADALVLLLGVTPAFGTVSPTSCKDGSRYMATSDGKGEEGRKGDVTWLGSRRPPPEAQSSFLPEVK